MTGFSGWWYCIHGIHIYQTVKKELKFIMSNGNAAYLQLSAGGKLEHFVLSFKG